MTWFVVVAQLWVVVGDAPSGIDFRCATAYKTAKKSTVQGCVCDRASIVKDVYSDSARTIYPNSYCPGKKGHFMSDNDAPADFCYFGESPLQKVVQRH